VRIFLVYNTVNFTTVYFYIIFNGVFELKEIKMIEGDLPNKAKSLVLEWAKMYKDELLKMWEKNEYKKLPGLE
jgi:hypothetical protein